MDLSHQSITGRQFELNRRGYDPDAVNAHLSEIAAAVGERERRIAELESAVESLQAKVQDANESEEALRLTLKAAAHAKEELLAGARDQAAQMEQEAATKAAALVSEATVKAAALVSEATAKANELTGSAEARAVAIDEEARSRAGQVAQASLAESQLLVERIQGMRQSVAAAEAALVAIQAETGPQIQSAREALDGALERAKEIAEDPSVLQKAAEEHVAAAASAEPVPEHAVPDVPGQPEADLVEAQHTAAIEGDQPGQPVVGDQPSAHEDAAAGGVQPAATAVGAPGEPPAEPLAEAAPSPYPEVPPPPESPPQPAEAPHTEAQPAAEDGPRLEVVAAEEGIPPEGSAADISDKVDRLLEELREVT